MAGFATFGDTRQSAEASGFFRWFMLDPVAAEPSAPPRRVAYYRPNGPAFHSLTEFVITTDATDRLLVLELRLARAFIDHPSNGLFARDIAKSVLRGALDDADGVTLADLSNEIEFPREGMAPVITARRVDIQLPRTPTPGYQVFLGRRGRFEQSCRSVELVMENYAWEDAPWFRMVLTTR